MNINYTCLVFHDKLIQTPSYWEKYPPFWEIGKCYKLVRIWQPWCPPIIFLMKCTFVFLYQHFVILKTLPPKCPGCQFWKHGHPQFRDLLLSDMLRKINYIAFNSVEEAKVVTCSNGLFGETSELILHSVIPVFHHVAPMKSM